MAIFLGPPVGWWLSDWFFYWNRAINPQLTVNHASHNRALAEDSFTLTKLMTGSSSYRRGIVFSDTSTLTNKIYGNYKQTSTGSLGEEKRQPIKQSVQIRIVSITRLKEFRDDASFPTISFRVLIEHYLWTELWARFKEKWCQRFHTPSKDQNNCNLRINLGNILNNYSHLSGHPSHTHLMGWNKCILSWFFFVEMKSILTSVPEITSSICN